MKGKSKLIKSGPGTWGTLASGNGTLGGQRVNVNTGHYQKKGKEGAAPSLNARGLNPMNARGDLTHSLKGV